MYWAKSWATLTQAEGWLRLWDEYARSQSQRAELWHGRPVVKMRCLRALWQLDGGAEDVTSCGFTVEAISCMSAMTRAPSVNTERRIEGAEAMAAILVHAVAQLCLVHY